MRSNYRKMPDGSLVAPHRGKEYPPCPKGFVRDSIDPYRFYTVTGFGDTVASLIDRLTRIKPCKGCKERQKFLNKILPYESKALYQELYKHNNYGQAVKNRCPGVRYYPYYREYIQGNIVDLGCGTGDTVNMLLDEGFEAVGYDQIELDNGMIVGDITKPLDLDQDTAISIDVFEHLYDDQVIGLLDNMAKCDQQVITVCTTQSRESKFGIDLHVNIKTLEGWKDLINTKLRVLTTVVMEPNRLLFLCERI